jgi:dipeptidyl aminopeptidase/acylaminoacyl peptidase
MTSFDPAAAFGARPSVTNLSVSPDGLSIAYIAPVEAGQGAVLYTMRLDATPKAVAVFAANGKPFRLSNCDWVSNSRLACTVYGVEKAPALNFEPVSFTRVVAIDADGGDLKQLSTRQAPYSRRVQLGGGEILDLLPDEDGTVLMSRSYLPDDHTGLARKGLGVDRLDTRTLQSSRVEEPRENAIQYISDGRGHVRIMALQSIGNARGQLNGTVNYLYRRNGARGWLPLSVYDAVDRTGFWPVAVDPDQNVALGYRKKDGRQALYKVALDGSLREDLVYAHPDVDVGSLIFIGRRHRAVGVAYSTDRSHVIYFDPSIEALHVSLAKALPENPSMRFMDASVDESRLLILAGSDHDPGQYYLFDRTAHQLRRLLAVREALEGVPLASVRPIEYPAGDGTKIPAYLTLPPGRDSAEGLPGIVMPHGGPSARDTWGFNWLAQYFAARGFAVLQPNYRGSSGYGDAWFEQNGFQSWAIAVGDVLDAGRWLVARSKVNPRQLAIVGWSYGGYAALQAAVVDPSVFKAVIAIAPVTDMESAKEEHRNSPDYDLMDRIIGVGRHLHEGSPLPNASRIKVPVLLFHGTLDRNVGYDQSRRMAAALAAAHVPCELVTFADLDHQIDDSQARIQMLRKSDAFLRETMGP